MAKKGISVGMGVSVLDIYSFWTEEEILQGIIDQMITKNKQIIHSIVKHLMAA